jgi:TP901 family phage tail tape measure protein
MDNENFFGLGINISFNDGGIATKLMGAENAFRQTKDSASSMSGSIDKSSDSFSRLTNAAGMMTYVGSSIRSMGENIIGGLAKASEAAMEYQKEMQVLRFVTNGTAQDMQKYGQIAIEIGEKTAFAPKETIQAMQNLASAGLTMNQVLGKSTEGISTLQNTLNLSLLSGGEISLSQGADLMVSAFNKFNLSTTQSTRIVNEFAQAANVTSLKFSDLAPFINSLGDAPAKLQVPMEQILALGGLLKDMGEQGAQAGATVNGFARQLLILSRQMDNMAITKGQSRMKIKSKYLESLGLDDQTIWDAKGNMKSLTDIMDNLIKQTANMSQKQKTLAFNTLFGDQASNALQAVDNAQKAYMKFDATKGKYVMMTDAEMKANGQSKRSLDELTKSIANSYGVSANGAKQMMNTAWGVNKIMHDSFSTLLVTVGTTIQPVVMGVEKIITAVLRMGIAFTQNHPYITQFLTTLMALTGGILVLVGTFVILSGAIIGIRAIFGELGSIVVPALAKSLGLVSEEALAGTKGIEAFSITMSSAITKLAPFAIASAGIYLAWKTNFMGLRTFVDDTLSGINKSMSDSTKMAGENAVELKKSLTDLDTKHDFFSGLTKSMTKVKVLWKDTVTVFNGNKLSPQQIQIVNELGLEPFIKNMESAKDVIQSFTKGCVEGFTIVSNIGKTVLQFFVGMISDVLKLLSKLPLGAVSKGIADIGSGANKITSKPAEDLGKAFGVIGTVLVTYKIATSIWSIVSSIAGLTKTMAVFTVTKFVSGIGAMGEALASLGLAFIDVGARMMLSPTTWIVLGIVGAVSAIYLLIKNWDTLKKKTEEVWSSIGNTVKNAGQSIGQGINSYIINPVKNLASTIGKAINMNPLASSIVKGIVGIGSGIVSAGKSIGSNLVQGIQNGLANLKGNANIAYTYIIKPLMGSLGSIGKDIGASLKSVGGSLLEIPKALGNGVVQLVKAVFSPLQLNFENIKHWVEPVKGIFKGLWSSAGEGLGSIKSSISKAFSPIAKDISGQLNGAKKEVTKFVGDFKQAWGGIAKAVMASPVGTLISGAFKGIGLALAVVKTTVTNVVSFIASHLSILGNPIKAVALGFSLWYHGLATIINFATPVFSTIIRLLGLVGSAVLSVVRLIAGSAIVGIIKGIGTFIVGTVTNIITTIGGIIRGGIQIIGGIIKVVWSVVSNIFLMIGNLISGNWSAAWHNFTSIFTGAWSGITSIFKGVGTILGSLIKGILTEFVVWGKSIVSAVFGAFDAVKKLFPAFLADMKNVGGKIISTIADGVKGAWKTLKDAVSGVFDKVKGLFPHSDAKEGPFSNLTDSGRKLISTMASGVGKESSTLKNSIAKVFSEANTNKLNLGVNKNSLNSSMNNLNASVSGALNNINPTQMGQNMPKQFGVGIQNNMKNATDATTQLTTGISNVENKLIQDNIPYGHDTVQNYMDGLNDYASNLLNTSNQVTTSGVRNPIKTLINDNLTYGQEMVQEFIDGINASSGNLTSTVKTLTDKVIQTFKEGFGIHSPSKVMFQMGMYLIQGLVNGMTSKDMNSFVKNWVGSMMQGATGELSQWIAIAMALTGVPSTWFAPLSTIIQHESGGNPLSINLWDSNAAAGHPSKGLMQLIDDNMKFALPGMNDIWNPIDNIAAGIGYIKSRYGDIFNVPGVKAVAEGRPYVGYINGTEDATPGIHQLSEDDNLEIVMGKSLKNFKGHETVLNNKDSMNLLRAASRPNVSNNSSNSTSEGASIDNSITLEKGAIIINTQLGQDTKAIADEVIKRLEQKQRKAKLQTYQY